MQSRIIKYVSGRVASDPTTDVNIISITTIDKSCYRKLVISLSNRSKPITVFLSPDLRFLSSAIYDLASDPRQEVALIASQVEAALMRDKSPQLSGADPQIVIVEFADFQCPYCKQFAEWYKALPPTIRDHMTLVFKQFPLPQHGWARIAAQYSACVGLQSEEAFWSLAAFLLENQSDTTSANIEQKIMGVLSGRSDINVQELTGCVRNAAGVRVVDRDIALADELAVRSTPTLFINGKRSPPMHSQVELEQLLAQQLQPVASRGPSRQQIKQGDKQQ